ncbi:hypothetical protein [Actinomadura opuntiae]|nr:hypothetical protein [Actinomadura sp. OS1-43]MDL4816642.1 hypothetical protein [Actinomadura sp. OS1-43]
MRRADRRRLAAGALDTDLFATRNFMLAGVVQWAEAWPVQS